MISEPLRIRVRGPWACFTRPEFHVERVSYAIMTPAAARGVLEAILMKPIEKPEADKRDRKIGFLWRVLRIGVVKKGFLIPILRNELGYSAHNFSGYDISDTDNVRTQRNSLILRGEEPDGLLEYLIEAVIEVPDPVRRLGEPFLIAKYQGMFERRVKAGQCFHRPYFGCREYPCDFEWAADAEPTPMFERFGMMFRDFDFDPVWEFWPQKSLRPTRWEANGRPVAPVPKRGFLAETNGDGWITVAEIQQMNGKKVVIER
jgi:CRISPR-associated protein Cas5d